MKAKLGFATEKENFRNDVKRRKHVFKTVMVFITTKFFSSVYNSHKSVCYQNQIKFYLWLNLQLSKPSMATNRRMVFFLMVHDVWFSLDDYKYHQQKLFEKIPGFYFYYRKPTHKWLFCSQRWLFCVEAVI